LSRYSRQQEQHVEWQPRTILGTMVLNGKINSMDQIFENGMRIQEPEIVKHLIPDIRSQVIHVGIVQKQTDAGEMTRFNALVAVGNEAGWFGVDKATMASYLNVIPVKLGCGSWECRCNQLHSIPFKVKGKGGSVAIEIIPGPRGLSLVAGENIKGLLKLAGIKDAWTKTFGSTSTMSSATKAIFTALRRTYITG
jgi:small subunit ribosomal protein S5